MIIELEPEPLGVIKIILFLLLAPFVFTLVFFPFVFIYLTIKDFLLGTAMRETEYRIYADGTVVHEDEFQEYDHMQPYSDDYRTVSVPDDVIDFIVESSCRCRQCCPDDPEST